MKTKYQAGSTVRTTQPPLGEARNVRGTVVAVHTAYDYKAPWERAPITRQNYVVEDLLGGAKYVFEERELRPDHALTTDYAGTIRGRKAARDHNKMKHTLFAKLNGHRSLAEIAQRAFPGSTDQQEQFIEAFKQAAIFPTREVFDE